LEKESFAEVFCGTEVINEKYREDISTSGLSVVPQIELFIVVGGRGICCAVNETVECRSGDLFAFDSGVPHGFFASADSSELRVIRVAFFAEAHIDGESVKELMGGIFPDRVPFTFAVLNSSAMSDVCRICGLIRNELEKREKNWARAVRAELSLLLITVGRYISLADVVSVERPKEWSLAFATIGEINRSYFDPSLTLATIAERLYVSPSALSRAFSKVMGETFHEYLRGVRIKEACALLEKSDMSNEEIAVNCGLRDLPTFYSAFKKSVGMTPKKYREMTKQEIKIEKGDMKMVTVSEISEMLQKGRAKNVKALVEQAIGEGLSAEVILQDGLIGGMAVVGERFKRNEVFVPEVLVAARAMNMGLEVLKGVLDCGALSAKGRVCIGTVRGDLHDIGKNLVKIMMESRGLEVIDLGVDTAPEKFIETAINENCQIICLSALLTTTMPVMGEVVKAAEAAGIRDKVKIMVGGAPVSEEYCRQIGADAYAADAATAAQIAVEFCAEG
jgi:methylmalonyl-CoA mutase cobalamin-binding domain/chain